MDEINANDLKNWVESYDKLLQIREIFKANAETLKEGACEVLRRCTIFFKKTFFEISFRSEFIKL